MNGKETPCGLLPMYKPSGITSHDAVNIIRRSFGIKRVGHTGTLDPMACGVLPILIGSAVKAAELIVSEDKRYIAEMKFGYETDTLDITGKIILPLSDGRIPREDEAVRAAEAFKGSYMQTPPAYSAIKHNGKKLYELARSGIIIETEPRRVEIFSISAVMTEPDTCRIDVSCSKGTYIRSLVRDIARSIGTYATMSALERVSVGKYTKDICFTPDDITSASAEDRSRMLIPIDKILCDLKRAQLSEFYTRLAKNGAEIYLKRAGLGEILKTGEYCLMTDHNGELFGVGMVSEYPDGTAVKAVKRFDT